MISLADMEIVMLPKEDVSDPDDSTYLAGYYNAWVKPRHFLY
jgi:hypothetical protein